LPLISAQPVQSMPVPLFTVWASVLSELTLTSLSRRSQGPSHAMPVVPWPLPAALRTVLPTIRAGQPFNTRMPKLAPSCSRLAALTAVIVLFSSVGEPPSQPSIATPTTVVSPPLARMEFPLISTPLRLPRSNTPVPWPSLDGAGAVRVDPVMREPAESSSHAA
jgi:hypothetical protein